MKLRVLFLIVLSLAFVVSQVKGATDNGNDLALYLSEAKDNKTAFDEIVKDTPEKNYYFRYLEIINMDSGRQNGAPFVHVECMEPSSYFKVEFTITKPVSLTKLMEEPVTKEGDAIAVTGKIGSIDAKKEIIILNPVIVRHKDRLTPKRGKELLGEVDPTARFYSFTGAGGKRVEVSYGDKDILPWSSLESEAEQQKLKEKIQLQYTKEEWADYLLAKLAQRSDETKDKKKDAAIRAGIVAGSTNAPVLEKK